MSIRKIDKNKYKIEVEKSSNGERCRKSKTITSDLKGLELKAYLNQEEINLVNLVTEELNNRILNLDELSKYTFREFAEWHIENSSLEQNTIDWYYKYLNNRTFNYFKDMKISNISNQDINKFFIMLKNTKSKQSKKQLSAKTITHYKTILHTIFEDAYKLKLIKENVVNGITIPKPKNSLNDKFYSPEEVNECITKLATYNDKSLLLIFSLSVVCGLRPAELRGLLWNKINFGKKEITIDRSLAATSKGNIYKSTKTGDCRKLMLTDNLIMLLREHKENELVKMHKLKIKTKIEGCYVFTNNKGNPLYAKSVNIRWKNFCEKNGIRYIPQYGFRHTTATMLAFNNIPLPNISQHMGHTNLNTTQIYVHAVDEMNQKIKEVFELNTTPLIRKVK